MAKDQSPKSAMPLLPNLVNDNNDNDRTISEALQSDGETLEGFDKKYGTPNDITK